MVHDSFKTKVQLSCDFWSNSDYILIHDVQNTIIDHLMRMVEFLRTQTNMTFLSSSNIIMSVLNYLVND